MKKFYKKGGMPSKFFTEAQINKNFANFLLFKSDELEALADSFIGQIQLEKPFEALTSDENSDILERVPFECSNDMTPEEMKALLYEIEALQEAYESLADALQAVTPNEPHPLASEAFSNQFKWHKSVGDDGTVYFLRHNELDSIETFIPEVCPYLPEQYFTKEALDFIKKSNH